MEAAGIQGIPIPSSQSCCEVKNQRLLKQLMGGAGVWTQEERVIARPRSVAARSQASVAPTGRKSPRTPAGGCPAGLEASRSEAVTAASGFVGARQPGAASVSIHRQKRPQNRKKAARSEKHRRGRARGAPSPAPAPCRGGREAGRGSSRPLPPLACLTPQSAGGRQCGSNAWGPRSRTCNRASVYGTYSVLVKKGI